jgi:uncharacterized protein YxeA
MNASRKIIAVLALIILGGFLVRNAHIENSSNELNNCHEYARFARNKDDYEKMVNWADKEIFSRSYTEVDFISGNFSGPGMRYNTLNTNQLGLSMPAWLRDYEVRILGKESKQFEAIFIGGGKYRGVIVARGDWASHVTDDVVPEKEVKLIRGRIGIICYNEP